jgi:hypothetical protein
MEYRQDVWAMGFARRQHGGVHAQVSERLMLQR